MDLSTKLITLLGQHGQEVIQALTADFSSLSQEDKEKKAAAIRSKCAWAVAGITPIPIPFADIWTLTPIQMAMVRAIGNIYGYKLSEETVKEVFAVIAGGIVGQQVCLALFKIGLPGAGGFGGAAFAFAWTHGIGIAAELYFKKDGDVSAEELEAARKEGAMEGKQQHQAGEGNQKFKLAPHPACGRDTLSSNFTRATLAYYSR